MPSNPYEPPKGTAASNPVSRTQSRGILLAGAWVLGVFTPALVFNTLVVAENRAQLMHQEVAIVDPLVSKGTLVASCVASLVLVGSSVVLTSWTVKRKIVVVFLSLIVIVVLSCGGVVASFAITGVPIH